MRNVAASGACSESEAVASLMQEQRKKATPGEAAEAADNNPGAPVLPQQRASLFCPKVKLCAVSIYIGLPFA